MKPTILFHFMLLPAVAVAGFLTLGACTGGGSGGRCSNGEFDEGIETDVDCGGICRPCAGGLRCSVNANCASGDCIDGVCSMAAPSCDDGRINGTETDIDCGGSTCRGCGSDDDCRVDNDCLSKTCQSGVCVMPATCGDAQLTPGETDVDCGGPCLGCATGRACRDHWDCLSATCVFGLCAEPSCTDGIRNQGEPTTDCGGPCAPCGLGSACFVKTDCQSGGCEGGVCCAPNACGFCGSPPPEVCDGVDNDCDGITDNVDKIGTPPACDRQSGVCAGATAKCGGGAGWICDDATYRAHNSRYEARELSCDGFDNDCDGATDEGDDMPNRPLCAKQAGVCAGSVSSCRGAAGNACTDADYKTYNPAYEAEETLCDRIDNDCDGQTDEGLRNQCGDCGPEPVETCDGVDNNCNGQTDEAANCLACKSAPIAIVDTTLRRQTKSSSWGGDAFRMPNGQLCGFFRSEGDNADNKYDNRAVFYCMNGTVPNVFYRLQHNITATKTSREVAWAGPLGNDIFFMMRVTDRTTWMSTFEFFRLTTNGVSTDVSSSFPQRATHLHRAASSGANVYVVAFAYQGTMSLTTFSAAGTASSQTISETQEDYDSEPIVVVGQGANAVPTVYYRKGGSSASDYDSTWRFWRSGSIIMTRSARAQGAVFDYYQDLEDTCVVGANNTMHFAFENSNSYQMLRHSSGQWAEWQATTNRTNLWYPMLALQGDGTPWLVLHFNGASGDAFRLYRVAQGQSDQLKSHRRYIGRADRPTGIIVDDEPRFHVFFNDERGFWNNDVTPEVAATWGYYMQMCPGMSDPQ